MSKSLGGNRVILVVRWCNHFAMNWLKRLFSRAPKIDDPVFGTMTFENGSWLALPNPDRRHMVILDGNTTGPTEQQRTLYTEIIRKIDVLTDDSIAYLRSRREFADLIESSSLKLYSIIIIDSSTGDKLDFTLEFSPDGDAIFGVKFVGSLAANCYHDH